MRMAPELRLALLEQDKAKLEQKLRDVFKGRREGVIGDEYAASLISFSTYQLREVKKQLKQLKKEIAQTEENRRLRKQNKKHREQLHGTSKARAKRSAR